MNRSQGILAAASADLVEELVVGNRIIFDQKVVDAFGHLSVRHDKHPGAYLLARNRAPGLVTADDILAFDLDSNPLTDTSGDYYSERFIHGEIYKARPDVMSVVHAHSTGVIPFTVSQVALRPMFHNAAFLAAGVPVWEIRKDFGETDMLVGDPSRGKSLAQTLSDKSVVLMRGHGDVAVGPSVRMAVFRAYYTDINARLQAQAIALGGDVNYLTPAEGAKADAVNLVVLARIWNLWKLRVAPSLGK